MFSNETLRKWMIENHLWIPNQKRRLKIHPLRRRKECFGEMIHIDGSHHDWFEGRAEKCVLIVFIDDATGKLTSLHFTPGESLDAYFLALEKHISRYGIPRSFYSDHFCVFEAGRQKEHLTQFTKALKILGSELKLASTPQAKGRVERSNRTLQDRLIKEMRLENINSIEEGNHFLERFIERYNEKFSKEPMSGFDAHRPLEKSIDISRILSRYEERTITKDLIFQFHNKFYQILEPIYLAKGKKIEVREVKGRIKAYFNNHEIRVVALDKLFEEVPAQKLRWKEKKYSPRLLSHPWKHGFHLKTKDQELKRAI